MATKIRLQRFGKKGKPFYHVVVADARAPRDGKFIERLGSYNPNTNPATIEINFEKALDWVNKGAQPTDTCRAILSYKGALMRSHLAVGVRKGAMTQEQADEKFANWLSEKENKVKTHVERIKSTTSEKLATKLAEEAKVNKSRLEKIAAKAAAAEAAANPVEEVVVEEAVTEEVAAEETAIEAPIAEAVVAEVVVEAPVAEAAVEEAVVEAPVAEAVVEEAAVEVAPEAPAAEATETPAE